MGLRQVWPQVAGRDTHEAAGAVREVPAARLEYLDGRRKPSRRRASQEAAGPTEKEPQWKNMSTNHSWKKVYVIQRMLGRDPNNTAVIVVPGERWSAIIGLRDDGRVFYSPFYSLQTHAVAEALFRQGEESWLNDRYCDRMNVTTGWVTDEIRFNEHCASLAATSVRDESGAFSMHERKDLEGEQVDHVV